MSGGLNQVNWPSGQDSNEAPHEYKPQALLCRQIFNSTHERQEMRTKL
jgi:hypothetical protein